MNWPFWAWSSSREKACADLLRVSSGARSRISVHDERSVCVVAGCGDDHSGTAHRHQLRSVESARLINRAIEVAAPISEREPAFYANLLGFASIPRAYPRTDLPAAESLLRRSLAFQESHALVGTGLYPNTKGELAQALIDQGRFEEAEPMLLDVVAQMKQRYG